MKQDFENEVTELLQAFHRGERSAFQQVRNFLVPKGQRRDLGMPVEKFELKDAQFVIARKYGFDDWEKIIVFQKDAATLQFETAVDAVVNGDLSTLMQLIQQNPKLVTMRSLRTHQATLLLYTGANAVEGYRQQSPRNTVEIAEYLLKSGAEVDAVVMHGGRGTTLGQVATSEHTARAGTQEPLMELLVKYGANVDGDAEGWQPLAAALDNARPEAAKWLSEHGATLNISTAAGLGRLDLVKKFFTNNDPASIKALIYAAMYGHLDIVSFLIKNGVDIGAQADDQYTALHYAAHGGHLELVEWLLQHNAPLEKKNCYGGTVLGQAIWSAANHAGGWGGNKPGYRYLPIIKRLIEAGAVVNPHWSTGIEEIDNYLRLHTKKPLPQLHKIMPEMPLDDVAAGVAWYRDVLGFSVNYAQEDIGVMDRDKARILLIARTARHTGIGSCYIYVHDADALYTEFKSKGVNIENEPVSQPWGLREFYVYDPGGNRLSFGQPFE